MIKYLKYLTFIAAIIFIGWLALDSKKEINKLVKNLAGNPNQVFVDSNQCENYQEIKKFEKPIPIVWTAKLDGCLVSCEGVSFTKTSEDEKYPRFAGYYEDGKTIPNEFLEKGLILNVYGKWTGIDYDHPKTVFDNKCVPIVDIEKIEEI